MFEIVEECNKNFLFVLLELLWTGSFECLFSGLFEISLRLLDHFFEWLDLLKELRVLLFDDFLNNFSLDFFFLGLAAHSTEKIASKKFDDSQGEVFCTLSRKEVSHVWMNDKINKWRGSINKMINTYYLEKSLILHFLLIF